MILAKSLARAIAFVGTAILAAAFVKDTPDSVCLLIAGLVGFSASLGWAKK